MPRQPFLEVVKVIHVLMGSMLLVFTFRTQESLSAVALKATSTPAFCETLLSLNAGQAMVAFANRVQEAPIEKIKSRSDAISFSRGDVVFVVLRTGLDEFTCQVCVLAGTSLGHSGPAPV